jgi:nucleotide-binding universal stress UspA family protein
MNLEQPEPGFEHDIRPLFRPEDVNAMSFAFNLASYEDVRTDAEAIYQRLADGSMPCDARWPSEQVERFRAWIDAGSPP